MYKRSSDGKFATGPIIDSIDEWMREQRNIDKRLEKLEEEIAKLNPSNAFKGLPVWWYTR